MLSDFLLKIGMFSVAFLGLIVTLIINREKLYFSRLKVEIMNDAFKLNERSNQKLDFQINFKIQAINEKICLRKVSLVCKEEWFSRKKLEIFEKATSIEGDLTKYSEDDFAQFISCLLVEYDCSKILEYESRFRNFIQLKELILEKDMPRSITLLGRILDYRTGYRFYMEFDYDLNGSKKNLSKELDFKRFLK